MGQELELTAAAETAATYHYQLHNLAGEQVGNGSCTYEPAGETASLACTLANDAFEFRPGNSYWASDQRTVRLDATWTAAEMILLEAEIQIRGSRSDVRVAAQR